MQCCPPLPILRDRNKRKNGRENEEEEANCIRLSKSAKLCTVFILSGILAVMCIARTSSVGVPDSVRKYLDMVMAVLLMVLLLCVLELCLGFDVCGFFCIRNSGLSGTLMDAEGQSETNSTYNPGEDTRTQGSGNSPPSYDSVMAYQNQEQAGAHPQEAGEGGGGAGGGAGGEGGSRSGSGHQPLKQHDFSFLFQMARLREDDSSRQSLALPPLRQAALSSAGELWLAVDGLPTYEEAMARLREGEGNDNDNDNSDRVEMERIEEEEDEQPKEEGEEGGRDEAPAATATTAATTTTVEPTASVDEDERKGEAKEELDVVVSEGERQVNTEDTRPGAVS